MLEPSASFALPAMGKVDRSSLSGSLFPYWETSREREDLMREEGGGRKIQAFAPTC